MTDTLLSVEIGLLKRHPELPLPHEIIARFAQHHSQSQARQRSHDELVASDSHLNLEDFGSLAASALGDGQDDVLEEGAHPFTLDESLGAEDAAHEPSNEDAGPVDEGEAPMPTEAGASVAEAAPPTPAETSVKEGAPKKKKRSRKRKAKKKG